MRSVRGRTASQTICAALCFAASLSVTHPALAVEYGLGDYLLGFTIPMSGYTPPPGVYFSDTFYLYQGSASANINFPVGRNTVAGLTYNVLVDIATVAWFPDTKILDATLGFAAAIPFGGERTAASVSFIGPLDANRTFGRTESHPQRPVVS